MNRKLIQIIFISLIGLSSHAQLVVPEVKPVRPITDASMIIQFGGQKLEVLPSLRAIRQDSGVYTIFDSDASEAIRTEKLGVAYSYAVASNVLFNGEISVKLKPGFSASTLGGVGSGLNVLVSPDIYVMTVTTPHDLVRWVNLLQAQPSVQWVEPFIVKARVN